MNANCRRQHRSALLVLLTLWLLAGLVTPIHATGTDGDTVSVGIQDGAPIRLLIPRIHLDVPVEPAGWIEKSGRRTWTVPNSAASWHLGSARVGEADNLVLSGHNNISGSVFRNLADLKVGDIVVIRSQTESRRFEITTRLILRDSLQSEEQRLENARLIGDFGEERITLVTCHPAWANTHRLIVVAEPEDAVSKNHRRMRGLSQE